MRRGTTIGVLLAMFACGPRAAEAPAPVPLPEPLANNAVAAVEQGGRCTLVTALGLTAPRADAIVSHAYAWSPGDPAWRRLPDVPGVPRIAASAVDIRGQVYVLGGYDVAADRHETSHAEMSRLDLGASGWSAAPSLPLPIDDAVALAWRDRWIVVVSGWSNDRPVPTVQLYDAERAIWTEATPFAGVPVFGHAAAIAGDELVVIDGVTKAPGGYEIVTQAWAGTLDPAHPEAITWRDLGGHPGPARYRAAAGRAPSGALVFTGGTADPYNFDGLSYRRHAPSAPEGSTLVWERGRFVVRDAAPSMDHRALARCDGALYSVGGMIAGPAVVRAVRRAAP